MIVLSQFLAKRVGESKGVPVRHEERIGKLDIPTGELVTHFQENHRDVRPN
jgi:hypothetical protein